MNELLLALDQAQHSQQELPSEQQFKSELFDLKLRLQAVQEEKAKIEQKLISAAQKDLQRDQSASTDQELRELQVKYDHIETQFAQTNVKLGDVLNQYNELEEQYSHVVNVNQQLGQENMDLRQALNLKSPSGRKK